MNKSRVAGVVLALLFAILFLCASVLYYWASGMSADADGPDEVAYEALVGHSVVAMIVFAILTVIAFVWAMPKERVWTRAHAAQPLAAGQPQSSSEIHWLKRNMRTESMLRWLMPLSYVVTAVVLIVLGHAYYDVVRAEEGMAPGALTLLKVRLVISALVIVGVPILIRLALNSLKHQLGTDGYTLYVKLAKGGQLSIPAEQLVYDTTKVVYRERVFPVQTRNRRAVYESGEIETHIAPLLVRAKKLKPGEMFHYRLAHRDPMLIAALLYAGLIVAAVATTTVWRNF